MKKFVIAPKEIRVLIYNVVGIVGILLAGFGLVNLADFQRLVDQIMVVAFPLIATLVSQLAAKNVHAGSDSTVTVEDVVQAQQASSAPIYNLYGASEVEGRHRKSDAEIANSVEDYISHQRSE